MLLVLTSAFAGDTRREAQLNGSRDPTKKSNPDVLRGRRGSVVDECLGRNDVLGARAFRALADGERHVVAWAHGVEWRTRTRGLVKEIFGALGRGDEAEPFFGDALDRAVVRHVYILWRTGRNWPRDLPSGSWSRRTPVAHRGSR